MSPERLTEMVVRTLRHEIGDLLQSVYSAVAILQERMPRGPTLERTILTDLRARAEVCKNEMDAAHDLVCPLSLNADEVNLGELSASIAATFSLRYPTLRIISEGEWPTKKVAADSQRLTQAGTMLMMALCPAARHQVVIGLDEKSAKNVVEWSFRHDGPAPNDEQMSWLNAPFHTTRHARFGLGLAYSRRIVELQGGSIRTEQPSDGGFRVVLVLPLVPA
jgi:K+-sensing histidine kinase KdpD